MLHAAAAAAKRRSRPLALIEATVETLPEDLRPFDVVTIGRALHWMEPERTKAVLSRLVAPGSANSLLLLAYLGRQKSLACCL